MRVVALCSEGLLFGLSLPFYAFLTLGCSSPKKGQNLLLQELSIFFTHPDTSASPTSSQLRGACARPSARTLRFLRRSHSSRLARSSGSSSAASRSPTRAPSNHGASPSSARSHRRRAPRFRPAQSSPSAHFSVPDAAQHSSPSPSVASPSHFPAEFRPA